MTPQQMKLIGLMACTVPAAGAMRGAHALWQAVLEGAGMTPETAAECVETAKKQWPRMGLLLGEG